MDQNKREKPSKNQFKSESDHGRIGRLDEQTLSYYRRVEQRLNDGFEGGDEDKELFLNNVFNTLSEEALKVSQNQTASNIVEHLLQEADSGHLVMFGRAVAKDWEQACTDRFASHVTQTYLCRLAVNLTEQQTDVPRTNDDQDGLFEILVQLYGFLMSNLAFHMQNTYTSHIVRVMLECLAGVTVSEKVIRSQVARHKGSTPKSRTTPSQQDGRFVKMFEEICDKIANLNKIEDHIKNHLSNPVLQTMLLALHQRSNKRCQDICHKVIEKINMFVNVAEDETDDELGKASLPEFIQHEIGSHFVEQVLNVLSPEMFDTILNKKFLSKMLTMAIHPVGNFVLQKLIKSCHTANQFELVLKKLSHHLEDILGMNHTQVIVSLAEGCVKFGTKQEKLVKALLKAFHCHEPAERQIKCVPLFASLTAYEAFYRPIKEKDSSDSEDESDSEIQFPQLSSVNLHGSLILQHLFKFGNPKLLVTSLLNMKSSEIKVMSCDPCGSHVIDVFVKSSSVGEKSRDMLYQRLKSAFLEMSCHKFGSRSLDNIFNAAAIKHRLIIAEELCKHETRIRGDMFGRFVWKNYGLSQFMRNRNQWKQMQEGQNKKRKMFEDILGTGEGKSKKKKPSEKNVTEDDDNNEEEESMKLRLEDSDDETESNRKNPNICEMLPKKDLEPQNTDTIPSVKTKKKKKKKKDDKKISHREVNTHGMENNSRKQKGHKTKDAKKSKDKTMIIKDKKMKELLHELDSKSKANFKPKKTKSKKKKL